MLCRYADLMRMYGYADNTDELLCYYNFMSAGNLIYADLTFKLRGILYKTHNKLGRYCNEKQYADQIEKYLKEENILYEREKIIPKMFEGEKTGRNKADFIIAGKIVLEIKTKRMLLKEDYYQLKRYIVAINKKLGILVNFRALYLNPKRVLNSSVSE